MQSTTNWASPFELCASNINNTHTYNIQAHSVPRVIKPTMLLWLITPSLRSLYWLKIEERIDYKVLSLTYKVLTTTRTILSPWSYFSSTISQHSFLWCCHPCSSTFMWKSTTTLSAMPHFVSGMNFPKNFANPSITSPCHCTLIFLSPVHHHHHHHHHHHFHYASLHLCALQTQNLPFL